MIDFFDFSTELLCVADSRGYFVRVNPAWTATLGWSAKELTSRPYLDFVHPDDQAATLRDVETVLSGAEQTVTFENRCRALDGSYHWLAWRFQSGPDAKELVASAQDVTLLKEQAEALRTAEERFRVLATQAPVCIFEDDHTGSCNFVNEHWCKLTGLSTADSLGFGWMKAIHPDDLPRALAKWEACALAKVEYHDEYRLVRSSGEIISVVATVQATKDAQGNVVSFIGTLLDTTGRKEAEDCLRLRESQLTGILRNSTAVIYLKDRAGRYLLANFPRPDLFPHLGCDVTGLTDIEIFPTAVAHSLQSSDAQVWEQQIPYHFEEVVPHVDGPHTYRSYKFPVLDNAGEMIALGGISTDITDIKDAHAALQAQQSLLRSLIEVQEREKQFLCHEFHDGLIQYAVGTLMLLEGCQRGHGDTDDVEKIDLAIANLRKGIEDGRRVIRGIRPAVLDDSGLAAAIEDLIEQSSACDILVTCKCDPEIGRLPESIQTTVYRVVQEALNNARKHSGTDVVRIELQKTSGDLCLEIRDFGCGFDVEPARAKGFGLLGMTERVRLLGGKCKVQSEPDVGTCIWVRLPLEVKPVEDMALRR